MNENDNLNNNKSLEETKEFKLILNLLEKAEQILSIINLPESSISKYNTLKKMTFDMLNIEFKPLEKKCITPSQSVDQNKNNDIRNQNGIKDEILYILHFINIKKTMLIDLILNFIINNNNIEQEKDLNYFLTSLTEIYNLPPDSVSSKSPYDISYETKDEESKLSGLFTKIDQIFMNNFEKIKQIKIKNENELRKLKDDYDRDLNEFKICLDKNNLLQSDIFRLNKENEKNNYYIDKVSFLINDLYLKFRNNFPEENNIIYNCRTIESDIMKLEFIKRISDKFSDNKNRYLKNDNNYNKDKNIYGNEYNFPYSGNYSNNNDNELKEILSNLPEIQKESDNFHKNFCDLMNYIETNIEGKNLY